MRSLGGSSQGAPSQPGSILPLTDEAPRTKRQATGRPLHASLPSFGDIGFKDLPEQVGRAKDDRDRDHNHFETSSTNVRHNVEQVYQGCQGSYGMIQGARRKAITGWPQATGKRQQGVEQLGNWQAAKMAERRSPKGDGRLQSESIFTPVRRPGTGRTSTARRAPRLSRRGSGCRRPDPVSGLLKDLTESSGEFRFGAERDVELKGLAGEQRVFEVAWN